MVETDGKIVTEEDVRAVSIPVKTKTFCPVKNGELIDMVKSLAETHGLSLENPRFALTRKETRFFGVYDVTNHNFLEDLVQFQVGLRNSCDKQIAAGVCFGSKVFVCTNLSFTGIAGNNNEIIGKVGHKHTPNVNSTLYERLSNSMSQFGAFKAFQENLFKRLRDTSVTNEHASHTIIEAARAGAITKKDILDVSDLWLLQERGPETNEEALHYYPEFAERNAYNLMNAFTENNKGHQRRNGFDGAVRSMDLTQFMSLTFASQN